MPLPGKDSPLVGQLLDHRYRIVGVIARGGMGVVYEGLHVGLRRPVAIKTILPRFAQDRAALARFHQEATLVGRLGHPHIVEVHDLGELADGTPYLVMERLEGETLTARLRRARPLPIELSVRIATQVLSALVMTHAQGILHLDLKPDNLWLTGAIEQPRGVKVIDFGVARITGGSRSADAESSVVGTPAFMPPEQAAGHGLDARADLYSVGMILYVCLTGRLPYRANSPKELLAEMDRVAPARPRALRREVGRALDELTMQALARRREDRPPDAASMLRTLEAMPPESYERPSLPAPPADKGAEDGERVEYFLRESILPPPADAAGKG